MRNLKRALSLVLAAMMLIGMMVVSAGAASKDFTDKDEITHTEAVEVMTALNVISGKEDGSYFDPTGTLTRAEMAKIISYVMNGGVEPVLGVKDVPTYSDIDGHWAEAYIEYCTSMGIIVGDGAGKFNPDGTLTATQCAKMFLTAMGYNAEVFGFTGNSWDTNTNRYANEAGLYKELGSLQPSAPISRDNACQMAYNAIQSLLMVRTWSQNQTTGQITEGYALSDRNETLLNTKFEAEVEYAYMTNISYDEVKKEYTYSFDETNASFDAVGTPTVTDDALTEGTLKSDVDYSNLFGHLVKVIYKTSDKKPVYGMYSAATIVAEGTLGDIGAVTSDGDIATDATQIKIDGTKYSLDGDANTIEMYTFNSLTGGEFVDNITSADYQKFAAIDNDGDGKINMLVLYPVTVAKVTYAGTSSVTAGNVSYTYNKDEGYYELGGTVFEFPEVAKGDFLAITTDVIDNMHCTAVVLETVEGKVTGTDAANDKVQVDGTWYPYTIADTDVTLNDTYKMQLCNGYVVDAEIVKESAKDILYVISRDPASNLTGIKAKVMFTDGTQSVIEISELEGNDVTNGNVVTAGSLYTYTVSDDGTYSVKVIGNANKAGYDGYVNAYDATTGSGHYEYTAATSSDYAKLNGTAIADDAVIFVKSGTTNPTYSVISGATLKTYKDADTNAPMNILTSSSNGQSTVKVATMSVSASFGVKSTYAFVTSAPYLTKEDGTQYANYTAWTVDGEITVKDKTTTVAKGDVVNLVAKSNGTYESQAFEAAGNDAANVIVPVAITGYNASDNTITAVNSTGAKVVDAKLLSSTTQYIYVNTKDDTGLEGGEIALAEKLPNGSYNLNAYLVYSCDGTGALDTIKAVIFDVNNDIEELGTAGYAINFATLPSITDAGTGMTISSITVGGVDVTGKTGTYYAVAGEKIVVTVKGPAAGFDPAATCTIVGDSGAVAAVVTAPTFTGGTTPGAAAATTTVTLSGDATLAAGGEYTFTWTVSAAMAGTDCDVVVTNS